MGLLNKSVKEVESSRFDDEYDDINEEFFDEKNSIDETYDDYSIKGGDAELSRTLIATEHFLNKIELGLLNQKLEKKRFMRKDGSFYTKTVPIQIEGTKPLMNNKGINQVLTIIRINIDQVISLTNLKHDMYLSIIKKFINDIARFLIDKRQEIELDEHNIRLVKRTYITNPVVMYLTKAVNDKERGYNYGRNLNKDEDKNNDAGFLKKFALDKNIKRRGGF